VQEVPAGSQEVRWLEPLELDAWRSFQVLQARLNAELARDLSTCSDLSYPDYVVLVALTDRPGAQMRVQELAGRLGWEKSRASHQVTRMVSRGLVYKCPCRADRRGALVAVTEQGRRAIRDAAPSHVSAVRRLFIDLLSRDQLVQLRDISTALLGHIGAPEGCCDGP